MSNKTQSIPDNTTVRFDLMGFHREEWPDAEEYDLIAKEDGKEAVIDCLATYTELGDKDYEYYNITFKSGLEVEAISGYHLTRLDNG